MVFTSEVELINFFIFNPKLAQKEGEESRKILYHHSQDTHIDEQLKNVGLCEALIKFTESFNADKPCHSFHTEKTKQFLHQAEDEFWLVMTVSVPFNVKQNDTRTENCSVMVSENVYEAVLKESYKMYRIFNNSFRSVLQSNSNEEQLSVLKDKLKVFYDSYLLNMKLSKCDILDVFQGIFFLPLNKDAFFHIQSFVNVVETTFKPVRHSAFLYDDQLVWSGINSEDTRMIYQFLVSTLLPSHLNLEILGGSLPRVNNSELHCGCFVTGPTNLKDSIVSTDKVPKVYLTNSDGEVEAFHLVVYQALSATLCLFIEESEPLTLDLFKALDSHLGIRLTNLVSEYRLRYSPAPPSVHEKGTQVLYFNRLNLSQKSTMHDKRNSINSAVPPECLRVVSELNAEISGMDVYGEVMAMTLNGCWLVGKFSNAREFYVIFTQKKGSFMDVAEEAKKLCESELKRIFFSE